MRPILLADTHTHIQTHSLNLYYLFICFSVEMGERNGGKSMKWLHSTCKPEEFADAMFRCQPAYHNDKLFSSRTSFRLRQTSSIRASEDNIQGSLLLWLIFFFFSFSILFVVTTNSTMVAASSHASL